MMQNNSLCGEDSYNGKWGAQISLVETKQDHISQCLVKNKEEIY